MAGVEGAVRVKGEIQHHQWKVLDGGQNGWAHSQGQSQRVGRPGCKDITDTGPRGAGG